MMQQRSPLLAQNVHEFWRSTAPPAGAVAFLAFVALGAAFIVPAKVMELPAKLVISVPVLIMLAYAATAQLVRAIRLRDDQTGDNLYYMGFIFTLISLAVALYQFNHSADLDHVVTNFGIAISSTIVGIALRVFFNQMRQDPIEVEHAARQELAEASRRVRQQLDDTVIAFSHFQTQVIQSLEEVHEELRKRLASQEADIAARAAKPIEEGAAKIGEALQAFAAAIDNTSGQLGTDTSRIASSVGEVESALTSLSTKLMEMQTPDRIIEVKLEPLAETLAASVTEFSKQSQAHAAALTQAVEALVRGKALRRPSRWLFWRR